MRSVRRIVTVVAAVSAVVAAAGGAAVADPASAPALDNVVGVSCPPLLGDSNPGGVAGTLVHDYDATTPAYPAACWAEVNPATGIPGDTITTKALNSNDKSCQMARPDGSSAGIPFLNANQKDTNTVSGQQPYCIDFIWSSRPPNTTTYNEDAFVAMAKDAITWSYPKISGKTNPQPKSLNLIDLENIYKCIWTNWDQIPGDHHKAPIGAVVPQFGSGIRATWLLKLGIADTTVEPCWQNGTVTVNGSTDVIQQNTGLSAGNVAQFTKTQAFGTTCAKGCAPQDDIFPDSIGDWIAQTKAAQGVGGHATSIWGHGNLTLGNTVNSAGTVTVPTSKNSKGQLIINPNYSSLFFSPLYAVTRNSCFVSSNPTDTAVCLPTTTPPTGGTAYPTYEATGLTKLFGTAGWVCTSTTAAKDFISYGFSKLKAPYGRCGQLTAGD